MWPYFSDDEINATINVLKSGKVNYWTGSEVKKFETEFANYIGTNYAIALANGTVALELALYTLNIGEGDEVIVTSRSFIASASSIILRGAKPIFADVDLISQNITLEYIKEVFTNKTKAIICVHLAGWPCDMDPIMKFAEEKNLYIIEDCAQAHGAMYKNKKVGSIGHINAWSFCQDKIMTTGGEGGMITLNNYDWYKKAWSYKDHGKDYDMINNIPKNNYKFLWLHTSIGTNWRMTEMQAAIGRSQLSKLDEMIVQRRKNADMFNKIFKDNLILRVTIPNNDIYHSYYKYYIFLKDKYIDYRDKIIELLNGDGIKCYVGSCSEIYLEKAFHDEYKSLPNAKKLGESSLMFLVHPTLDENRIKEMAINVKKKIDIFICEYII